MNNPPIGPLVIGKSLMIRDHEETTWHRNGIGMASDGIGRHRRLQDAIIATFYLLKATSFRMVKFSAQVGGDILINQSCLTESHMHRLDDKPILCLRSFT